MPSVNYPRIFKANENKFTITGVVSNISAYEKYDKYTVRVKHFSRRTGDEIASYVTFRCYHEDNTGDDQILLNDPVEIVGHLNTRRLFRREDPNGRPYIIQMCVGDEVKLLPEPVWLPDKNIVEIAGVIENVHAARFDTFLQVATWVGDHPYTVELRIPHEMAEGLEPGMIICTTGRMYVREIVLQSGEKRRLYSIRPGEILTEDGSLRRFPRRSRPER